jgi:tetratricopeptide (TPR) repeat protein
MKHAVCAYLVSMFMLCAGNLYAAADNLHRYILANYYQFQGKHSAAKSWYSTLLAQEDIPEFMYKGYLVFLYETNSTKTIMELMPKVDALFAKDPDVQLLLAHTYAKVGKQDLFKDKMIKLAMVFPQHPDIVLQAAQVYATHKELENAIKVLDTFLNTAPSRIHNFIFYFMKSQVCMQLDHKEDALRAIKRCLEIHPSFSKGWLLFALLEEQEGRLDQAIKGYTTFLESDPAHNAHIQQHLIQLTLKQQAVRTKNQRLLAGFSSAFEKAVYCFNQKDYLQALEHIDVFLQSHADDQQARLFKIQVLSSMDKQGTAADLLKQWLLVEPTQDVWLQTLHLLCGKGLTHQKAVAILDDVIAKHKNSLEPLLYVIDIATRGLAYDAALFYYKKALKLAANNDLKARLYFHMGQLYYKKNDFKKMHEVLEKGHALGVKFAHLDNMLAYYYAKKTRNLARAQTLLDTILHEHKTNPYFQDTQAFVYYKQRRYDEAVSILEAVAQKIPDNFYVLKHLGKTYFKLGNKDQARTMLEKALEAAESEHEKQKCKHTIECWSKST